MAVKLTQLTVDLLNNAASMGFSDVSPNGQMRFLSVQVPISAKSKATAGDAETAAVQEAIRILNEALELLNERTNGVFS